MAYDPKLGYDPDRDYTAAYATETDPINRGRIAEARGKKKAAMTAAGTYDTAWDEPWNKVFSANPVLGMSIDGSYGAYGSTPIGQMGMGGVKANPYGGGSSNPYTTAYNNATTQLGSMKQEQIGQVNSMYDKQATNAYVQREQQTKNLPTQLAAQGITGGMAESSAVRIGTAYGNNIATNEAARMGAVSNINIASSQQAMQMALDYADRMIAQQNADRGFERGVMESDRNFGYQQGRDTVGDNRYNTEWAYGVGRDAVGDARYTDETAYSRGRDNVGDMRYADETAYGRGRDTISDSRYTDETAYGRSRDAVSDSRYSNETAYNRQRDNVGDSQWQQQFGYNAEQDAINNAYRQQTDTTGQAATPYSMGNYATGLVETYTKSEGNYDLIGALNKAYESGLISAEDFAGALIQAGIDPYAQDAQSTDSGSTTLQGWVSSPNELGYGPITEDKLRKLVDSGEVTFKYDTATGKMIYKRAK
jgi:hypothetical protein